MCSMFFMVLSCIFAVFCVYFLWVRFCVSVVYVLIMFLLSNCAGSHFALLFPFLAAVTSPSPTGAVAGKAGRRGGRGKSRKKLFKKLIRAAATLPILWSFIWVLKMIKWKKFMEDISNFPPHPNPEGTGAFYGRGVILDKVILHHDPCQ